MSAVEHTHERRNLFSAVLCDIFSEITKRDTVIFSVHSVKYIELVLRDASAGSEYVNVFGTVRDMVMAS